MRKSQPRQPPIPDPFDLDQPLLYFSPVDAWTTRDACEGVAIFGSIGSGKTSGSGAALAKAYLRAGFGGMVLCAKPEERALWEGYAKATGRSDSLIIVSPETPWRFNFLDYELTRSGRGSGQTENIVNLLSKVTEVVEGKVEQNGESSYWNRAMRELVRNSIDLLALSQNTLTLRALARMIADAPQRIDQVQDEAWQQRSFLAQCLKAADEREKTESQRLDLEASMMYWLRNYAGMDDRPRSGIVSTLSGVTDLLSHGYARDLLATTTNLVPEVTYRDGAIILLDVPIQVYDQMGRVVQGIFKLMFQKAILRRDAAKDPRPVFLWQDEYQNFASSFDYQVQAVARSARLCTVVLTQSISNLYTVLGSRGRDEANALLGNFQTKVFHAQSDSFTNQYGADLIAQDWKTLFNFGTSVNETGGSRNGGGNQTLAYKVLPGEFTTLRKGGPANQFQVDGIIFQGGRRWKASGDTYLRVIFNQ